MNNKVFRTLMFVFMGLAVVTMLAVSPLGMINAAAAGVLQVEPPPPPPTDGDPVIIIPDTGQDTNIFVDNWLVWVILGIVLLVLLVALLARGASGPHHHHD